MKNLLLTIIFFLTVVLSAYSQIHFKDRDLAILEKVAFEEPSYEKIKRFMKKNYYYFEEKNERIIKTQKSGELIEVEYLIFLDQSYGETKTIKVAYNKKTKVFLCVIKEISRVSVNHYRTELEKNNFVIKDKNEYAYLWKKSSYKFQITIFHKFDSVNSILFATEQVLLNM